LPAAPTLRTGETQFAPIHPSRSMHPPKMEATLSL
jgi:hypothetical protein